MKRRMGTVVVRHEPNAHLDSILSHTSASLSRNRCASQRGMSTAGIEDNGGVSRDRT